MGLVLYGARILRLLDFARLWRAAANRTVIIPVAVRAIVLFWERTVHHVLPQPSAAQFASWATLTLKGNKLKAFLQVARNWAQKGVEPLRCSRNDFNSVVNPDYALKRLRDAGILSVQKIAPETDANGKSLGQLIVGPPTDPVLLAQIAATPIVDVTRFVERMAADPYQRGVSPYIAEIAHDLAGDGETPKVWIARHFVAGLGAAVLDMLAALLRGVRPDGDAVRVTVDSLFALLPKMSTSTIQRNLTRIVDAGLVPMPTRHGSARNPLIYIIPADIFHTIDENPGRFATYKMGLCRADAHLSKSMAWLDDRYRRERDAVKKAQIFLEACNKASLRKSVISEIYPQKTAKEIHDASWSFTRHASKRQTALVERGLSTWGAGLPIPTAQEEMIARHLETLEVEAVASAVAEVAGLGVLYENLTIDEGATKRRIVPVAKELISRGFCRPQDVAQLAKDFALRNKDFFGIYPAQLVRQAVISAKPKKKTFTPRAAHKKGISNWTQTTDW